jgi:hypothetical protein
MSFIGTARHMLGVLKPFQYLVQEEENLPQKWIFYIEENNLPSMLFS